MGAVLDGRIVSAALEPVLGPAGFAEGQYGESADMDREAQVIFCAGHGELNDRYPWLPQATEQPSGRVACIDLVLDIDAAGRIVRCDLEGWSLEETLRSVGLTAAAEAVAQALATQSAEDGVTLLDELSAALGELFGTGP